MRAVSCLEKRTLRGAIAAIAAICSLGSLETALAQTASSGEIIVVTYGGLNQQVIKETLADPFTEATKTAVRILAAPSEQVAQFEAQVRAGKVVWDVFETAAGIDAVYLQKKGYLASFPPAMRDKLAAVVRKGSLLGDVGVEFGGLSNAIACNTKEAKACPRTPAEFFDVKNFPGPRSMYVGNPLVALVLAEEASGVPKDKLFPIDIDRAFKKLNEIKSEIRVWYKSGDQSQQTLRDGEVVMGILWDGRAMALQRQGVPVQLSFEGAAYEASYLVVPKGAPHEADAFKYIEWVVTNPEALANYVKGIRFNVPNPKAFDLVPPEIVRSMAAYPENFEKTAPMDLSWYLENRALIEPRWKELVSGG